MADKGRLLFDLEGDGLFAVPFVILRGSDKHDTACIYIIILLSLRVM